MPTRCSSWERPCTVIGARKSQAGARSARVQRVRGTPHWRGSRRRRCRSRSWTACSAACLAARAAAASTAGEAAAAGVGAAGAGGGGRGGKSGLAPASWSEGEEAGHPVGGKPLHPVVDRLGAARPQEAAPGHGGRRGAGRDFEQGGGALALIRLGAGIPTALQRLALLGSEGNRIHRQISLANSTG